MSRMKILVLLSLCAMILVACGGQITQTKVTILDGEVRTTTFDQVKKAIDDLYSHHPSINSFAVQSVTYTPQTRDKVLTVCREGSLAADDQERERQKVLACAPLIFFFYSYGQQTSAPESVDVARQLYWYAMTDNSVDAQQVLTDLLRSWEIK
jgi:hypothetical protein